VIVSYSELKDSLAGLMLMLVLMLVILHMLCSSYH